MATTSTVPAGNFTIKPTAKFVIFSYATTLLLALLAVFVWYQRQGRREYLLAILVIAAFGLVMTAKRHLRLQFTSLAFDGTGLKFQDGFLSKSTRMLNMSKIQDVRVDQSITERILGIGTLTFETAGESGRLVMEGVDQPQEVAQRILSLAHASATPGASKHS